MPRLENRSIIVTGGASGLGEATSKLLAERGVKVVVADLSDETGNKLASEIGGAFCHTDVTNTDEVIAAIETAKDLAKANPGTGSYEIRPVAELHDYHLAEQRKPAA